MKPTVRMVLVLALCLMLVPAALAKKRPLEPAVNVAGVYEDFTVGKESGDLEGMRVVIVAAGGAYHAIVQIAQGGAEDPQPEFVDVSVSGKNVQFKVNSDRYVGTVSAAGLKLKDSSGMTSLLKRKSCAAYFNARP